VTMPLATRILSGLMVLVGLAMIVSAVARGGGPLAYGVILGILFIAVGAGRLWTERRR
jgi:hypothetical protein